MQVFMITIFSRYIPQSLSLLLQDMIPPPLLYSLALASVLALARI